MTPEELLADTNRLLRELAEAEAKVRADAEVKSAEFKEKMAKMAEEREAKQRELMKERGLPENELGTSDEDFDKRRKEAQERLNTNALAVRERESKFKDEMLAELRIQSDLLRQIGEKLGI